MYKIYCSVLNKRPSTRAENNNALAEEQKCFRKHRSTIDLVSTLSTCNFIGTRKITNSQPSMHLLTTERLMTLLVVVYHGRTS